MSTIFALVSDVNLRERVEIAARKLSIEHIIWELELKGAIARVAEVRPVAMVIDLRNDSTPWHDLAQALKSNPATRRLGIVAFATDLDQALRAQAVSVLIDEVFDADDGTPDKPLQTLADRIKIYARRSDTELQAAIADAIELPLPAMAHRGLIEFNARQFYEAHEYLEYAWVAETDPIRDLYRGVLQIAVAYHHIEAKNYRGALKMFLRALQWLEPLPDRCQGINVAKLRDDSNRARQHMESLGPDELAQYDLTLLKPVEYDTAMVLPGAEDIDL